MKVKSIVIVFCSFIIGSSALRAQEVEDNIRMDKVFKADGVTNEWKEPLDEYNSDTGLAFALANDDKQLYIVIESLDPQTTFSVLRGGITLNINTSGKKRQDINLTFPMIEHRQVGRDSVTYKTEEWAPDATHDAHPKTGIKVSGFKAITDGYLTPENDGGIKTGMVIKPNRDLIYELSIPLAQLQVDVNMKKPLMYDIKINAPSKQNYRRENGEMGNKRAGGGMGGGRGGMSGRGMGGGGRSGSMGGGGAHLQRPSQDGLSANKPSDFWIKFKLAKA